MTWISVAVSVAGTVYSASQQADAAENAANTQAQGNAQALAVERENLAERRRQFDIGQRNLQPWIDNAMNWLPRYSKEVDNFVSGGLENVQKEPGYQFGLQQGQQALDRKTAAAGGRVSGAALKQANRYATDYATAGYDAAYRRSLQRLDRIAQMAGHQPIKDAASSTPPSSSAISGLLRSSADDAASAQLARGNIYGGAVNQVGAFASRGFRDYFNQPPTDTGGYDTLGRDD